MHKIIKTFVISLPAKLLQMKSVKIVLGYERFRDQQNESERQAEMLFRSLLQRAFAGDTS